MESTAPDLILSLWSIRDYIDKEPNEALTLVKELGFNQIEIASFHRWKPEEFSKEVAKAGLTVHSLHGPLIRSDRNVNYYCEWASQMFSIFGVKRIVFESEPRSFRPGMTNLELAKNYEIIYGNLMSIAETLNHDNIEISYHAYDHDYQHIAELQDSHRIVAQLFQHSSCPSNLGLQIDTYWLNSSGVLPSEIEMLGRIHSVHLNERNQDGGPCRIATESKRLKDLCKEVPNKNSVSWILENDPSDEFSRNNESAYLEVIGACVDEWPNFWAELQQHQIPPINKSNTPSKQISKRRLHGSLKGSRKKLISEVFESEIRFACTEFLFGNSLALNPIDYNSPIVTNYVRKRRGFDPSDLTPELSLYEKFWIAGNVGKQLIYVKGTAGAGKSTFLRYFFQYFLHHKKLLEGASLNSRVAAVHTASCQKHVVFYVDIRRPDDDLKLSFFRRLKESIVETLYSTDPPNLLRVNDEEWVESELRALASKVSNGERRHFISIVIDNVDQLTEEETKRLHGIIGLYLSEEPPRNWFEVKNMERNHWIWRIVVPLRPETVQNMNRALGPWKNLDVVTLGELDEESLVSARTRMLTSEFVRSNRQFDHDIERDGIDRAYLGRYTAADVAEKASRYYSAVHKSATSRDAIDTINYIINGSARKRISVYAFGALSHSFINRFEAHCDGEGTPVSPFYFFDAILRGDFPVFDPRHCDHVFFNVYDLGATPGSNRSILIGLHALFLLNRTKNWDQAKRLLLDLGYSNADISSCENAFTVSGLISRHWGGGYFVHQLPVSGHLRIIRERAYTDTMAVACAVSWNDRELAEPTDPLDPKTVIKRFSGSVNFLERILDAEEQLRSFKNSQSGIPFGKFYSSLRTMRLPYLGLDIAREYLNRIQKVRTYDNPESVIVGEISEWNGLIERLTSSITNLRRGSYLEGHY